MLKVERRAPAPPSPDSHAFATTEEEFAWIQPRASVAIADVKEDVEIDDSAWEALAASGCFNSSSAASTTTVLSAAGEGGDEPTVKNSSHVDDGEIEDSTSTIEGSSSISGVVLDTTCANGELGVSTVLEILRRELDATMALTGVRDIDEITKAQITSN